ncbi:MFS general substrate transporter [Acaromyces ingoldii]|uniref:MFS general substrate transporter n=1 Tax=Acaromyces ingoldii TaxID=215250 RepID=A0A316YN04_9BASI|nr:MFS general substrate transporter [Acaromyces ingoldii]PWN90194.1 MFS general substrate transporter [Acaromyces ingoldii]
MSLKKEDVEQKQGQVVELGHHEGENNNVVYPRWYRTTFFQMLVISGLAFAGPAMSDAISNLGGGGMAKPYAWSAANAANYSFMAAVCMFGGPIVSKIGLKAALIIGAACFPLEGSALYVTSQHANASWYLIFAESFAGIGLALWYVGEAAVVLSYPEPNRRGKYLALWIVSRNLGQLVGGAINLAVNKPNNAAGSVSPKVYIVFMVIEALGFPIAWLISQPSKVQRADGSHIRTAPVDKLPVELKKLLQTLLKPTILLILPFSIYSFFYISVYNAYLTDYFTVRARALSSLISPFFCIVGCFGLGILLDHDKWNQRKRAILGFAVVVVSAIAINTWSLVVQVQFKHKNPGAIDWTDSKWPKAFLSYFFINTFGPIGQSYMYWLISCYSTDVQSNARMGGIFRSIEAVGQAISYVGSLSSLSLPCR